MVTVPGSWRNLRELEESVTLEEMTSILNKSREMRRDEHKFVAEVNGKSFEAPDGAPDEDPVKAATRRAQERILKEQEEGPTNADDFELSQEVGITFRRE